MRLTSVKQGQFAKRLDQIEAIRLGFNIWYTTHWPAQRPAAVAALSQSAYQSGPAAPYPTQPSGPLPPLRYLRRCCSGDAGQGSLYVG
jgi:hypothetical protein